MTRREREYEKKVNELIDKVGKLQDKEVEKVLGLLENARVEVAARVASTEWDLYYIPQLRAAVDNAIETFKRRYLSEQVGANLNMWNAGIDMVDSPLQFVGIRVVAPELGRSALEILQGYSADLVGGLTTDALKKINGEIAMGLMGAKPMQEVMKAVGRNLDDPSVFTSIASRAETITRTEMGHVNSAAREARAKQTAESNPELKWMKKWISSGKFHPRLNHAELNGVMVPVDQDFPGGIPYPHAPGLPASEVVNCG